MAAIAAMFRGMFAAERTDTSLDLPALNTASAQFAQATEDVPTVAFDTNLSDQVQILANDALEDVDSTGSSCSTKVPLVDFSSGEAVLRSLDPQASKGSGRIHRKLNHLFAAF
jgi:hypothetical protein